MSKFAKRIILVSLITAMGVAFIGYKFGFFDNFLINQTDTSTASKSQNETDNHPTEGSTLTENTNKSTQIFDKSLVSIVQSSKQKADQITQNEIRDMVENAINLAGGFESVIKDTQVVVLKPNLVQMHVDSTGQSLDKEVNGVTTDWRVTKAVAEIVRKYNPHGKIYVMEGSGGDPTTKAMKHLNYTPDMVPDVDEFISIEDDSGKWQDFNSQGLIKYSLPNGLLHKEYYLNKKYFECDVLISIPCLKTNSGAVVSGSIKNVGIGAPPANIYGVSATNPGKTHMVSHKIIDGEMDKWLHDYYMCKPVNFVIMDGLQGFQNGPVPIGKSNIVDDRMNMKLIIAGKDSVAVDSVEALITGWDPQSITYLKHLSDSGMGKMDMAKINVVGKFVDEVRKDFKIRFSNLGGVRVQDREAPKLAISSQNIDDKKMNLALDIGEDTVKVEVFIDDKLQLTALPPDCKNIILDISKFSGKDHNLKILSYDRFMNHSEVKSNFLNKKTEVNVNDFFTTKANLIKAKDIEGLIKLSDENRDSNTSSNSAYFEFPKQIIRLAHNKAMEKFNAKDSSKATQFAEYGLNEYAKVFLKKALNQITIEDISINSEDKYKDLKIPSSEFILILNNYAYFIAQTGDDKKAEPLLAKVIELSPDRAVAYIDLGNVSWNLGKKEDAKKYYRRYLDLLGNNTKNVPSEVYERLK